MALFDYGRNAITETPLRYDRRSASLANGFVVGCNGSEKSTLIKREILQVLSETQDDVIVIDPEYDYARNDRYIKDMIADKCRRIELEFYDGGYHINPLDVVIDSNSRRQEILAEQANYVASLIQMILFPNKERELSNNELRAIYDAVFSVLNWFVDELTDKLAESKDEYAVVYDFEKNPTFGEVIDCILSMDGSGSILEMQALLKARKPYLTAFYGKTNIPEDRGLVLSLLSTACKFEPFYYAVTLSYINRRILTNRRKGDTKLWVYFDEAHLLFYNEYIAHTALTFYKRSRANGAICTAISHNLYNFTGTEHGRALVANSGFMIFLNQSSVDRELMQKMFLMSEETLKYTRGRIAGSGIFYDNHTAIPFYGNALK